MTDQQKTVTRSEKHDEYANKIFRAIDDALTDGFTLGLRVMPSGGVAIDLRDLRTDARNEPVWFVENGDVS